MQSQLSLDLRRFELAAEEAREARANREMERTEWQKDREVERAEREIRVREHEEKRLHELRDREEAETRRKQRFEMVAAWIQEGRSPQEISMLAQAMFGQWWYVIHIFISPIHFTKHHLSQSTLLSVGSLTAYTRLI